MDVNENNSKKLVSLYKENRISAAQLKELQEDVNCLSDEELSIMLYAEWQKSLVAEQAIAMPDLTELSERIHRQTRMGRKKKHIIHIWSTVASIAALFILVFLFTKNEWVGDAKLEQIAIALNQVSNDTEEIQLILDAENTIKIEKGSTVAYQKDGTVSVDEKKVENSQTKETNDDLYNRLLVPKGRYANVTLSDGTKMYVNAGTKVVYPTTFSKECREIYVDGEVFLDVAPNKDFPFIVRTASFDVRVLGTAFNINAYNDTPESKEVVLARGKVNVTTKTGKRLELLPDSKATILFDGNIIKSAVNAEDYMLWTKGLLSLKNEQLHIILIRMSRYYGSDIKCTDEIASVNINGKIDLECTVEEALKRISTTGGFSYHKEGNTHVLTPRVQ